MFQDIIYIILQHTPSSENSLDLKLAHALNTLCLFFYQINGNGKIQTCDCLVIKALI